MEDYAKEIADLVRNKPFDFLAAMLDAELQRYKVQRTTENKQHLMAACTLLMAKNSVERNGTSTFVSNMAVAQNAIKYFNSKN